MSARRLAGQAARGLCVVLAGLVLLQFYAAGIAVFGAGGFGPHRVVGWLIIVVALLNLVLTLAARGPRGARTAALAILVLSVLQPMLAFAPRARFPELSAVHVVNALVIALLVHANVRQWREHHRAMWRGSLAGATAPNG